MWKACRPRSTERLESRRDPEDIRYSPTELAKRALIMQAFAYHQDKKYEEARAAAQRYIDFYPADEDAAYAQYLLALSYYDQIDEVGRDQGLTFQALQALRTVIERYPDSEWARSAVLKFDLAFDHLAAKEMEIGRFYMKRQHYTAGINRFRVVVEEFQTTTHTPEALYRLVEAYLALGLNNEAQTAGAILGHNFRSTEWYQDAFTLLTGRACAPRWRATAGCRRSTGRRSAATGCDLTGDRGVGDAPRARHPRHADHRPAGA
jgi:outer membrane protein assembly factor BamD